MKHHPRHLYQSYLLKGVVMAAALTVSSAGLHAAQSAGVQAPAEAATIAQASGFVPGPTSFSDGRPELDRFSLLGGRLIFDEHFNTRFEARENNNDFNSAVNSPTDASWLLTRFRVGALFHATSWLRFYVQGQDIRELGGSRPNNVGTFGADGDDVFDIIQAWIEAGDENRGLSLRAGRQPFNYGNQRLLGNPQWKNSTNAWDAIRLHYAASSWSLDMFTGSPVTFINNQWNQSDTFNTHESRNAIVSGAWFSSKNLIPWQSETDIFLFHQMSNKSAAVGAPLGAAGRSDFWNMGTLWKGDPARLHQWDYELEANVQFGRAGGLSHRAFATHAGIGYNFKSPWKPRLGAQYNYASGDASASDGKSTTFQNMFPGNHAIYGFMDTTGWMNMMNPQVNFSVQPTEKLKITFDWLTFWNATNGDAWYAANTSTAVRPVNAAATSASRYRGMEFDLNAYYKLNRHLTLQTGYSMFLAGSYLAQTGASDNAHFGYLQMTVNF